MLEKTRKKENKRNKKRNKKEKRKEKKREACILTCFTLFYVVLSYVPLQFSCKVNILTYIVYSFHVCCSEGLGK